MKAFKSFENLSTESQELYKEVYEYVSKFLTSPHPSREGSVCPFIHKSLSSKTTYFREVDEVSEEEIDKVINQALTFHKEINSNKIGSVILLFPLETKVQKVNDTQRRNKVAAVDMGLMIGSLHPENNSQSIHNENFFPLRSPSPIIVIRDMVYTDLNFLKSDVPKKSHRIKFLSAYLKKFGERNVKMIVSKVTEAKVILKKLSE